MKQRKILCHCTPKTHKNNGCRSKKYVILRRVNAICIAPQHIPKAESYNPQAKN